MADQPPLHVIHHHPCYDGFTAAWVVRRLEGDQDLVFHRAQYGDPMPVIPEGEDVLMVDVSWPRDLMHDLADRAGEILVLDHHKTAEAALAGLEFAVFDMGRSGAGLAWDYLSGGLERPALVDHVEDRDLWQFEISGSKQVHAFLSSLPWSFEAWDEVHDTLERDPDTIYSIGGHIRRYQERRYEDVAKLFHRVELDGVEIVAANVGLAQFKSGGIHHFLEHDGRAPDIAGAYMRGTDGLWYWSLRAKEGHDCSELAQEFGGGGHAQAAGFSTSIQPTYKGEL